MDYSLEQLKEAKRQIASTLHKLRETAKSFELKKDPQRYKSQITLARRRIEAFAIAEELIDREICRLTEPNNIKSSEDGRYITSVL